MLPTSRWILAAALAAGLAGCNAGDQAIKEQPAPERVEGQAEAPGLGDAMGGAAAPPAARSKAANQAAPEQGKPAAPNANVGRYVIRRASVNLEVKDVRAALTRMRALAESSRGYVSDSSLNAAEGAAPSAQVTLRVPAARFDALLDQLGGLGTVRSRQVSGEDVTMEYVDTSSRIRNMQREEAQLLKLLNRTGDLSDVLAVERELARVRGEIEQAQGRLRQLSQLVDLATIEVHLAERVEVAASSPWQLGPTVTNAWQNAQAELAEAVAGVVRGAIWLVAFVLPLLVPALLLYLLIGWALSGLLVGRFKLLDRTLYRRIWAALGLALLAVMFPPVAGVVVLAAVALAAIWAGSSLFRRSRRRED